MDEMVPWNEPDFDDGQNPFSIEYWWDHYAILEEEFGHTDLEPLKFDINELKERNYSPELIADLLTMSDYSQIAYDEYMRWREIRDQLKLDGLNLEGEEPPDITN